MGRKLIAIVSVAFSLTGCASADVASSKVISRTVTSSHVVKSHVTKPTSPQPLSYGMRGARVAALNARLLALNFLPSSEGDVFGAATRDAVIAFQKWEGLTRDGVVGSTTEMALNRASVPTPLLKKTDRRIEISLSKQVALEISANTVLWVLHISTGRPGLDTPTGEYHVFSKFTRSWSVPYQEWLPYASYFNGGIALHGYDSVPVYAGSHGCVRIPLEFALSVFQFDTIGTEVDIIN